tara:strand:- start:206 stop:460 length:255 start_codon:yes stop_codon:yes gene_type:complete
MATGFNVNSNISSMKTYRAFAHSQTKLEESIERLSTGLRINKASDDTEGAAIATRLGKSTSLVYVKLIRIILFLRLNEHYESMA